jgi:hypothetical protein
MQRHAAAPAAMHWAARSGGGSAQSAIAASPRCAHPGPGTGPGRQRRDAPASPPVTPEAGQLSCRLHIAGVACPPPKPASGDATSIARRPPRPTGGRHCYAASGGTARRGGDIKRVNGSASQRPPRGGRRARVPKARRSRLTARHAGCVPGKDMRAQLLRHTFKRHWRRPGALVLAPCGRDKLSCRFHIAGMARPRRNRPRAMRPASPGARPAPRAGAHATSQMAERPGGVAT